MTNVPIDCRIIPNLMGGYDLITHIDDVALVMNKRILEQVMERIVTEIVDKYIKENYSELVKGLDVQAITNLAIASAGAELIKSLGAKK